MAIAYFTIPGSVAVLINCSTDLSARASSNNSSSAHIRAGTRMSSRQLCGTCQTNSEIRSRSCLVIFSIALDVNDHARFPAAFGLLYFQVVIRDCFYELGDGLCFSPLYGSREGRVGKLSDVEGLIRFFFSLLQKKEFAQPIHQQRLAVNAFHVDFARKGRFRIERTFQRKQRIGGIL